MATRGMSEFRADGVDYTVNDPNIAKEFDATAANAKGDYVNYQGDLYRFTAAHTANTAWGSRSKTKIKLGEDIKALEDGKVPKTRKVNGHALSDDVTVTKDDVGLGNADNTSDTDKPVSTATAEALDLKVDKENIENDLTGTSAGYVLDARQGKVLNDKVSEQKSAFIYDLSNNETQKVIDYFTNGTWYDGLTGVPKVNNTNTRIRPFDFIAVSSGDRVIIDNGTSYKHAVGVWNGTRMNAVPVRSDSSFNASDETIDIINDGFMMVVFADSSDTSTVVDPSLFDGEITVISNSKALQETVGDSCSFDCSKMQWANGTFAGEDVPRFVDSTTRIHSEFIDCTNGDFITVESSGDQEFCIPKWGIVEGEWKLLDNPSSFSAGKQIVKVDGSYRYAVIVRKSTNGSISPSDLIVRVNVYRKNKLDNIGNNIGSIDAKTIDSDYWEQGTFAGEQAPRFIYSATRIHTTLLHLFPGNIVEVFTNGQKIAFGAWKKTNNVWSLIRNDNSFITSDTTFKVSEECYYTGVAAKTNNDNITPSECLIDLRISAQSKEQIDIEKSKEITGNLLYRIQAFGRFGEAGYLISHRGLPYPENTMIAFENCIDEGSKILEMDVAFTSDNVPVLLHDTTINRTGRNADGTAISSTINISDITYEESQSYDFGIWKGEEYAGEKLPKLQNVLLLLKWKRCCAILDLLGHTYTDTQYAILHDLLDRTGMKFMCALNVDSTRGRAYTNLYNDTPINPTSTTNSITALKTAVTEYSGKTPLLIASGYAESAEDATFTFFSEAKRLGVVTIMGMIETASEIKELFGQGCDLIYSDTLRDSDIT